MNTGATLSYVVEVADLNDETPVLVANGSLTVTENDETGTTGTLIGTITSTDADAGDTASYAIVSGNSGGYFSIADSSNAGEISVAAQGIDYETATDHTLVISVTDGNANTSSASYTISVININDEAPIIDESDTLTVFEDASSGAVAGMYPCNRPRRRQRSGFDDQSYSITGGTGQGSFSIGAATGVVSVSALASLDHETTPSYTLLVQVEDNIHTPDSFTYTVTIQDKNDAPVS